MSWNRIKLLLKFKWISFDSLKSQSASQKKVTKCKRGVSGLSRAPLQGDSSAQMVVKGGNQCSRPSKTAYGYQEAGRTAGSVVKHGDMEDLNVSLTGFRQTGQSVWTGELLTYTGDIALRFARTLALYLLWRVQRTLWKLHLAHWRSLMRQSENSAVVRKQKCMRCWRPWTALGNVGPHSLTDQTLTVGTSLTLRDYISQHFPPLLLLCWFFCLSLHPCLSAAQDVCNCDTNRPVFFPLSQN